MIQFATQLVLVTLCSALVPCLFPARPVLQRITSALLLVASGVLSVMIGGYALSSGYVGTAELPFGLPWMSWHVRLDSLSAFFLIVLGLVTTTAAVYSLGYNRHYDDHPQKRIVLPLFTGLYVAGMQLVLLADDAFAFMVAWEWMSLASFFLVAFEHKKAETRRAAFLYLLMAHIGGLAILLCFGVLAGFEEQFVFDSMRSANLSPLWASVAFGLAFFGFGTKAGLIPMHAWLPEAHPVAPSHISALLSAVIVKMALYGFLRVVYDLIGVVYAEWGLIVLIVATLTALYGVFYAVLQRNIKKLLAYSTIENIGVIFIGVGLSLVFKAYGERVLSALALIAALYHALNHACFKGLLFMSAGSVLHKTHQTDLNHLGGLIHRMPWTAFLFLLGGLSMASLPPFNGFVSEWLTFQSLLQVNALENGIMRASIPMVAAGLALTAGLAAAAIVKVYGVAFLGVPRSKWAEKSHEVAFSMRLGMGVLAIFCLALGILPTYVIELLDQVTMDLIGVRLPQATANGWLWLTPVSKEVASYSAPLVFLGILLAVFAWFAVYLSLRRKRRNEPVKRVDPWDCGFGGLEPRMQYSAESFSMPFQRLFGKVLVTDESIDELASFVPGRRLPKRHALEFRDWFWVWFYQPVAQLVMKSAKRIGVIQTGHLRHYLTYSFVTLVLLLWVMS